MKQFSKRCVSNWSKQIEIFKHVPIDIDIFVSEHTFNENNKLKSKLLTHTNFYFAHLIQTKETIT